MAISYVDAVQEIQYNLQNPREITLTALPTHATDDLLIAFINTNITAGQTPQFDDDGGGGNGWVFVTDKEESLGRDNHCAIYYKIATSASETLPTFKESDSTTQCSMHVTTMSFRGVDTTTPLDATTTEYSAVNEGDTPTSPSITTVTDDAWVLTLCQMNFYASSATATPPSGYTEIVDGWTANNNYHLVGYKEVASAGAENPGTWTVTTADTASELMSFTMALRPAVTATEYTKTLTYTGTGTAAIGTDASFFRTLTHSGAGTAGASTKSSFFRTLTHSGTGTGIAATKSSFFRSLSYSGVGTSVRATIASFYRTLSNTGTGTPAYDSQSTINTTGSSSGVGSASSTVAVSTSKAITASAAPSLVKKVSTSKAYTNTGTAAMTSSLALTVNPSMTGTAQTVSVTPRVTLTLSPTFTATGLADLTRHIGVNRSYGGSGSVDKTRGISVNKDISGTGTVDRAEAVARTKTLTYTGVGSALVAAVKRSPVVVTATNVVRQLFSQVNKWF